MMDFGDKGVFVVQVVMMNFGERWAFVRRRGSRILKWGVNFCNNVIEPKPG